MASSEVIKEFLLKVAYSIDQSSETRFQEAIKKHEEGARRTAKAQDELGRQLKNLGLLAVSTATTFAAGIVTVAKNYEQLYYVVQRTTASAEGLAKLQYAFGQVGLSGDAAVQMILRMTNAIKASPGLSAVLRGISGDDPTKLFGTATEQTKVLIDFLGGLSKQSTATRAAIAQMFGISQDDLERLISTLPDLQKAYDDMGRNLRNAGVDQDKFFRDSRTIVNDLKEIWTKFDLVWQQSFEAVFDGAHRALKAVSDFMDKVLAYNKEHPFAAVIQNLGVIAASITGILGGLRLLRGLIGLGGGGGAAAAGAAGGVGALGGALAVGAGAAVALAPSQAGDQAELTAEQKLFAEARRRAGAREVYGPPVPPGLLQLPGWLNRMTTGHYQHGGVVPIGAHAGEMVLPRNISEGLQGLYGAGGQNYVRLTYEAMSRFVSSFELWLRGGGLFSPRVVPVPEAAALGGGAFVGGRGAGSDSPNEGRDPARMSARAAGRWLAGAGNPLALIEHFESGGRNVMNYINDAMHTAGGFWQITNSTWRRYAGQVAGAAQYAAAILAPRDIQRKVAQAIYNAEGFAPWENYDAPLHAAINRMATTRIGPMASNVRHGDRAVTLNQNNTFNVAGGAGDNITGRLTRVTDRLAGDTIRNFQVALS